MAAWLFKSEADSYSWDDLVAEGATEWTGVRNHAAAAHLRAMQPGDRVLFYHSGAVKAVVGIAEIVRGAVPDGDERPWVSVEIRPVAPLSRPVPLATIKATPALAGMAMLRQSRLSVSPVSDAEWDALLALTD